MGGGQWEFEWGFQVELWAIIVDRSIFQSVERWHLKVLMIDIQITIKLIIKINKIMIKASNKKGNKLMGILEIEGPKWCGKNYF